MALLDDSGLKYFWGLLKDKFAPKSHTHTKSQITDFPKSMPANGGNSTTVNGHSVNSDVPAGAKFTDTNTWRGVQNNLTSDATDQSLSAAQGKVLKDLVDGKAASGHTHDDRYYTESEVDSKLDGKANTNHSHSAFGKATADAAGSAGYVPAPAKGQQGQYLRGDGTWATPTDTTYGDATTSAHGLMTAADKAKLNGIASNANNYSHPGYTSKRNGFYKVTVDGTGHVSGTTAVTKADITGLGIPAQDTTYSAATSSTLGLVKVGSNISNSYGTISLTKANVTSALGYTPPTTNTTYGNATTGSSGLMSSSDKSKLDGIASGANKTVVDNALSQGSANPVANSAITKRLQFLYSFKISRDKWNESSDKSNWNVIVPWSDSKGTVITATASSAMPNLTTNMSLGPAMMERTSSLSDNVILSGELSMINQGQIYVCETNKLSFTVKRRPVCDLMLYFYARQWTT